jgi:hypothetical protein
MQTAPTTPATPTANDGQSASKLCSSRLRIFFTTAMPSSHTAQRTVTSSDADVADVIRFVRG